MVTEKRKRKEHVPPTCTHFLSPDVREEIHNAIARLASKNSKPLEMGFGGLDFCLCELRYELCGWLISQYDFTYHRLNMETAMLSRQ
ncbi:hypothetical protein AAG906_015262 [Vitis piasezkii]